MERQCQLAEVSRAGFYRYLQQSTPVQADLLLRARLQEFDNQVTDRTYPTRTTTATDNQVTDNLNGNHPSESSHDRKTTSGITPPCRS